jgi:hypothetical protein
LAFCFYGEAECLDQLLPAKPHELGALLAQVCPVSALRDTSCEMVTREERDVAKGASFFRKVGNQEPDCGVVVGFRQGQVSESADLVWVSIRVHGRIVADHTTNGCALAIG